MTGVFDWDSRKSVILKSPVLPPLERENELLGLLPAHVWLGTSGTTTGRRKWVGLSQGALLASAAAVNARLSADKNDIWLNPLPLYHVGGLGILARAHLTGSRVEAFGRWSVEGFLSALNARPVTLTSLVPTQVFDLVQAEARAPRNLRAVMVGGGSLRAELYQKARRLGWPLLPSYGLSECSSQVATAAIDSLLSGDARLEVLRHVEVRLDSERRLEVKSQALLTAFAEWSGAAWELFDPKVDGWYKTEDFANLDGGVLEPLGRAQDQVKILGELVNLAALNQALEGLRLAENIPGEATLVPRPDPRAGIRLDLVTAKMDYSLAENLRTLFNKTVAPFERSANLYCVAELPRTELGKLNRPVLLDFLGLQKLS